MYAHTAALIRTYGRRLCTFGLEQLLRLSVIWFDKVLVKVFHFLCKAIKVNFNRRYFKMQNLISFYALIAYLLVIVVAGRIVRRNVGVEVRNGRSVVLRKEELRFNVNRNEICKVEVVTNEPLYQRVGLFKPKVSASVSVRV